MFLSGIGFVYKTRRGTDPILEKERALGDIICCQLHNSNLPGAYSAQRSW